MSDSKYLRKDMNSLLGHAVEECGEVAAAIGKTIRWGLDSINPELDDPMSENNGDWILRELADLDLATDRLRTALLKRGHNLPRKAVASPLAALEKLAAKEPAE